MGALVWKTEFRRYATTKHLGMGARVSQRPAHAAAERIIEIHAVEARLIEQLRRRSPTESLHAVPRPTGGQFAAFA